MALVIAVTGQNRCGLPALVPVGRRIRRGGSIKKQNCLKLLQLHDKPRVFPRSQKKKRPRSTLRGKDLGQRATVDTPDRARPKRPAFRTRVSCRSGRIASLAMGRVRSARGSKISSATGRFPAAPFAATSHRRAAERRPKRAAVRSAVAWGQQPLALTKPQPNSVFRVPGPKVSTLARSAARIASAEAAPRAICRAIRAVTIGAAKDVPLT